ncbi:MAG: type II 3-dehydroquinate dehydratase [archaeon]|nr:type II 3-dehydroquinate dehydratase [archaeon]
MASGLLRGSVLVLHGSGVTLRGVGKKEIETFGPLTFGQYEERIRRWADEVNLDVTLVQSNWEGALIDALVDHFAQAKSQYVIVNPAGFTWGYPALAKALAAVEERMPAIEVRTFNSFFLSLSLSLSLSLMVSL